MNDPVFQVIPRSEAVERVVRSMERAGIMMEEDSHSGGRSKMVADQGRRDHLQEWERGPVH